MQTQLDPEIVSWIGRVGAASSQHVQRRFGMGRRWAYHRLKQLVDDRLLTHQTLLYRQPGLYIATAEGLRWGHQQRLGVFRLSPAGYQHSSQLAQTVAVLESGMPGWRLLTDRELRATEHDTGELTASIKVGELAGKPLLHRPDLALLGPTGRTVAVEVELSTKARQRLQAICRGYARARHIHHTCYLTTPTVARALRRAITDVRANDRITILPLDDVGALIACERETADAHR